MTTDTDDSRILEALSASTAPRATASSAQRHATRVLFMVTGCAMAAWAALVPFAKTRAGLDEGMLGALLLCLGLGSLIAMPPAGALTTRYGSRAVLNGCALLMSATLPLLATATSLPALALTLFVFGAAVGASDCAFNVQAVLVEQAARRPLMSGFHGFYSLGGIVGAGGAAELMSLGLSPLGMALVWSFAILVAVALSQSGLLSFGSPKEGPWFAAPRGIVLLLGVLGFIVFLAEGALLDWSAVLLAEHRGVDAARAGIGYASFALTMTIGRLTGDAIVARLGRRLIVRYGALLSMAGLLLTVLLPSWQWTLVGCAFVGLGCANIVPVLYTAAGRQITMPRSVAIPALTTVAYAGVLAGPAGIGFIAHVSSLPAAFLVLASLLFVVAACSRYIER